MIGDLWTSYRALEDFLRANFIGHDYSFMRDQLAALGQQYVALDVEPFQEDCYDNQDNLTGRMLNQLCYEGKIEAGVYVVEGKC